MPPHGVGLERVPVCALPAQCDRILLRAQTHAGGFGIYRPNVTITTYPADLAAGKRALVLCNATGDKPCIRTGDGFYGGAAAINLNNFGERLNWLGLPPTVNLPHVFQSCKVAGTQWENGGNKLPRPSCKQLCCQLVCYETLMPQTWPCLVAPPVAAST